MASTDRKLQGFLLAQSPAWLADRLLGAAASDPALLAELQAAGAGSDRAQVVRQELGRAIRVDDGVEWDDAHTYVYRVDRARGRRRRWPAGWVATARPRS